MKRCAVYSRVSTTIQADVEYNSCEAQRDRILSYIKSQENLGVYREYSDPGFSAATLERPALRELLQDVADRKIDVVLTYKIDRLTRSSKDFYNLIEYFEKYGVAFVSVSEHFDTSSASGRLLRNIMLTFAQFEREMTSERIKDKFEQRALKGFWNGAPPPLGYKNINKKLVVDRQSSAIVKSIFEEFVTSGSFVHTAEGVRAKEIVHPRSGLPLSKSTIGHILRNPVYIGKVRWRKNFLPGQHEAIISEELFDAAQGLLKDKVSKKRVYKEYLLGGLVRCSDCGSGMTNSFTNKKSTRYYYYKCTKVAKEGRNACSIKYVSAERLEKFLSENLCRIASDRQYIENLVFRLVHQEPRHIGFKLTAESVNGITNRIQQMLSDFKDKFSDATQVEKCLIFQRTVGQVNFSKETLEVVVSLRDGRADLAGKASLRRAQLPAARIRVGEHERQNSTQGESLNGNMVEGVGFEPTRPFGLTVFKTAAIDHSAIPPSNIFRAAGGARPSF
jgi:site-specific DNA recombinase